MDPLGNEYTFTVKVRSPHSAREIQNRISGAVGTFVANGDRKNGYEPSVDHIDTVPFSKWYPPPWTPPKVGEWWYQKVAFTSRRVLWVGQNHVLLNFPDSGEPRLYTFADLELNWEKTR